MSDQSTAMDLSSPQNGKSPSTTPMKAAPASFTPTGSRLSPSLPNTASPTGGAAGGSPHMPLSAMLHRSPPSSHKHMTHHASSGSITELSSPVLRLGIKQSPAQSPAQPNHSIRPPQLDLSPTQSPIETTPVIPRIHSMPPTSASPSSATSASNSSSSSPSTQSSVPPLSFRLKLSSLEVSSPHHDPIVLSSPPSSSHSASMPSPHTLFTARIPRLSMPSDEDNGGSGSEGLPSQRPHIPMLSLNVNSSPTTATRPFKHALNITTLNTSSGDSPHTSNATSTASPVLPTGNSSHDRAKRLAYYSKQATSITDFLYVGGKSIAADRQLLLSIGITHVVNLVGDLCDNYFPDDFVYQRWFLLDHAGEDIICILYPVMELIEWCRLNCGKVLIHCQQGVSRSCVLCIAYIMYSMSMDYDAAFQFVRQRRGICRPNVGFMAQLLAWHKRLTAVYHPLCLYRLAPHCSRDHTVVGKWVDRVDVSGLDERGVFVLHSNDCLYIWVGAAVGLGLLELYYPQALLLIERLRKFEHAPQQHVVLYQRDERVAPEHKHGTAVPSHHIFHESTSSPSLSISSSPSASSPSSPLHSPAAATRPVFPANFTESQKFWALLGGGSPLSTLHCSAYDDDYSESMLAELPQRPASVPLPHMISARSVSSPATAGASTGVGGAVSKGGRATMAATIVEEDVARSEGESEHVRLEKEVAAAASSTVSPPLSQRESNDNEVIELRRRRSYHKSIDATYLTSAHDHHYASIRPEEEVDDDATMTDDAQPTDRTSAGGSLTARVDRLSMAHAGVEEADEETDAANGSTVPHASLYTYPAFENLDHFDSDDLNEDGVFVLLLLTPHTDPSPTSSVQSASPPLSPPQMTLHIWLGAAVSLPAGQSSFEVWAESIAIEFVQQFQPLRRGGEDNVKVVVERQNHESDEFWEAFVDG